MKKRLALVGFALFVLVDAALLVALHQHLKHERASAGEVESSTPASRPTATATIPKAGGAASLVLSSPGLLARVLRGKCVAGVRPGLGLSRDGGKTFSEIGLPVLKPSDGPTPAETIRTILQVRVDSPQAITVVASDDKCVARRFDTVDGGGSWTRSSTIKTWYVDAAGTGVVSPTGASDPGCTVVQLSPDDDSSAKALCADSAVRSTTDGGNSWSTVGKLDGVTAGTFNGLNNGVASAPDGRCKSSAFVSIDAGVTWTKADCISAHHTVTSIVGTFANLYALVGTKVRHSSDNGATWEDQSS